MLEDSRIAPSPVPFFTNPSFRSTLDFLPEAGPERFSGRETSPFTAGVEDPDHVKLSSAWLIQAPVSRKTWPGGVSLARSAQGRASPCREVNWPKLNRGGASAEGPSF